MKVECWFDSEDFITRNNNILTIQSSSRIGSVEIIIRNKDGGTENSTVVDGMELIKAIQNAMNS